MSITEKLKIEKEKNSKQIEVLEHQKARLENRIAYLEKGERAKRTLRLCEKGGAIESICPETKNMNSSEFYLLMEKIFSLPDVQSMFHKAGD